MNMKSARQGRIDGWERALAEYVESSRRRPFSWQTFNCVFFVSGAAAAMTGRDPAARYVEDMPGAISCRRIVRKAGGMQSFVSSLLGEEIAPRLALRGDALLFDQDRWSALGLCLGAKAAAVSMAGLTFAPSSLATAAWRIG